MKLLIVDDHAGARDLIRAVVARLGYEVRECDSGAAAIALAPAFAPDWVTVDLLMPGMNGFALLRALRAACPAARLVMVSSYDDREFQTAALAEGAVAFVPKDRLPQLRTLMTVAPRTPPHA